MRKEVFKEKRDFMESEIVRLRNELKKLESDYIDANKKFNIGDRIYNPDEKEFGYVRGFETTFREEIKTLCFKEKKDGTVSKINMWVFSLSKLELAPKV